MNQDDSQHEVADLSLRIKSARKPEEHGATRKFVKGTLKLAIALLIVALIIAGIAAGIGGIIYLRQEANNRPLAEAKIWREIAVPSLENATMTLTTKWQHSKIYYQLNITGYPAEVRKEFEPANYNTRNDNKGLSIIFLDRNGFKVNSMNIPLHSMTRISREDGGCCSGLSANDSKYLSADEYREIAAWQVQWKL